MVFAFVHAYKYKPYMCHGPLNWDIRQFIWYRKGQRYWPDFRWFRWEMKGLSSAGDDRKPFICAINILDSNLGLFTSRFWIERWKVWTEIGEFKCSTYLLHCRKERQFLKKLLQVNYILKSFVPVDSNDWLEMLVIKVNPEKYLK